MSSQRTNGDPAALKARRSSSQGGRRESSATNDNSDSETDSGYPPSVTLSPTGALPEPATSDQIHETSSSTAMKRPHRSISSSSGQARPSSTSSKGHHSPPSLLASPSGTLRSKLSNSPECLEVDPTTMEIREHIESMIEKLIDGSLDEAPIGDLSSITEYQTLKSRFLYEISEGLARLGYALQICLNNEPSDRSEEFVPSVIHSALSTLIQEMELEAEKLPLMLLTLDGETCPEESLALQTYEDLLSSAIINKAVLKHQACLIPKIDTAKELLLAEKIVISDDGGGTSPSVDDKEEEDVDDKEDEGPSVDDKEEEDEREIHCREKQEDRVDVDVSVEEISTNGLDENVQTEKVKAMDEVKESVEVTSCHEELEETISSAEKVECDSAPEEIMEENEAVEKPSDKGESAVENGVSEERVEKSSSFTTTNHPEQSEEAVDHDVSSGELAEVKVERPKPAASIQEQEDEDVESDTTTSDLVSLDTDSSVESTDRFVPQKGVHYIVEESLLEEITTAYDTDDSEAGKLTPIEKKWTRIRKGPTPQSPKLTRRVVTRTRTYRHPLNGESSSSTIEFLYDPLLEPQTPRKVIFPELGVDLISEPSQRAKNLMRRQAQNRSSWSENWIFQPRDEEDHSAGLLRRFSFGESSERSIPMLVPHPREKQFRSPRVGGRDVHELSDLSDEMFPDVSSGSSSSSSSRTSSPERSAATTTVFLEPKLHHGSPGSGSGESSSTPVSVPNSQRESEYTEDYEALAQISKPPTSHPVPRPRKRSMQPAFLGPSSRPPVSPTNPIVFITAPGNSYLHVGQHLSLSYSVVIREDDEWSGGFWYHNGTPIHTDHSKGIRIFRDPSEHGSDVRVQCFQKFGLHLNDSGTYSFCAVTEKGHFKWHDSHVIVRRSTQAMNHPDFQRPLSLVENTLKCQVLGYPEPLVRFFCDDEEILPSVAAIATGMFGEWSVELSAVLLQKEKQEQIFRAVASNEVGSVTSDLHLHHEVTPVDSPRNGSPLPPVEMLEVGRIYSPGIDTTTPIPSEGKSEESKQHVRGESPVLALDEKCTEIQNALLSPTSKTIHTIAEREHQKWLNAPPIENNPYSAENLLKRVAHPESYLDVGLTFHDVTNSQINETFSPIVSPEPEPLLRIDCGPKEIDATMYQRDYYIPGMDRRSPSPITMMQSSPQESKPVDAVNQEITGHAIRRADETVEQDRVPSVTAERSDHEHRSRREASKSKNSFNASVEEVKAFARRTSGAAIDGVSKETISQKSNERRIAAAAQSAPPTTSAEENEDKEEAIAMPSVKELAKLFGRTEAPQRKISKEKPDPGFGERETVVGTRQRFPPAKSGSSTEDVQQFHSLTARRLPVGLLEAVKKANDKLKAGDGPKMTESDAQTNNPVCATSPIENDRGPPPPTRHVVYELHQSLDGYAPRPSSSGSEGSLGRRNRSITIRANYWDKRVKEGLLSDRDLPPGEPDHVIPKPNVPVPACASND